MALKLRLQLFGSKNKAFFQVVVADSRCPRNGRFIERIGYYNPRTEPSIIELNVERAAHWYKVGARPSDSVASLFRAKKIDLSKV
jgi:small subunit ribosomal protein S16